MTPIDPTHIWVLIPAARQHITMLWEALDVLGGHADHTVIVANGPHPPTLHELPTHILYDKTPGVNISRWWNIGLDWIEEQDQEPHHVLVLNADTRISPSGVAALSHALDAYPSAAMAGPMRGSGVHINTQPGPVPYGEHVPGYCFMLSSEHRLRADERFRWWAGDNDLEWRAREAGGTLLVGPIEFRHLGSGIPQGECVALARDDLWRFQEKWLTRPWP